LVCPPSPRAAPRSPPPFPTRRSSDLAGPPEQHLVTRPCLRGPWTTEPLVTVHEDVQGELPRLGVVVPHGVGTHTRPLVTRQGRLHGIEIERFRIADARHGEQHFDVAVGETVVLERSQPLTPAHDPDRSEEHTSELQSREN